MMGPPVYRGMSREELERQYNARESVADFDAEMAVYDRLSAENYRLLQPVRDLAYGPHPDERIDLFPAKGTDPPLFVYVHGGYWRALGRENSAFMAGALVQAGICVAIVEYSLAPAATLDEIVGQVRRAMRFLQGNARRLQLDEKRLVIGGSSAGAHLAAMSMLNGECVDGLRGALLVSGLYDLTPVRMCLPNSWLKLDEAAALRNSPLRKSLRPGLDVVIAWGEKETAEFRRQSVAYAENLQNQPVRCTHFEVPDRNHFDVIVDLADPRSRMFAEVIRLSEIET